MPLSNDVFHLDAPTHATRLDGPSGDRHLHAEILTLRRDLADRDRMLAERDAAIAHGEKIFERASTAARIGVWECDLNDFHLTWTDVVYDIFELPRGSSVDRVLTLGFYDPASAVELEARRSAAIASLGSFTMDARILTTRGNPRWIRITAQVESEDGRPLRLFGMKQDITEEKLVHDHIRYMAEHDVMTGLANRSRFHEVLSDFCAAGRAASLMLIDLDNFKAINDTFGHLAGDACLKAVAQRLTLAIPGALLKARIGGDEFAVLVDGDVTDDARRLAEGLISAMSAPIDHDGLSLCIGVSVGVAPVSGASDISVFRHADIALYAAKAGGRNTVRIFADETAVAGGVTQFVA